MQTQRPLRAMDPRRFGRARALSLGAAVEQRSLSEDLQLFATTFVGGFVFVSVLLA